MIAGLLSNLTTRRAFILFSIAYVLGVASILANFWTPWFPACVVLIYGIVLFYAAKVDLVSHSDLTNNSPYFLGFTLFLTALFVAFSSASSKPDSLDINFVLKQLGSALLTTIVGFPLRQLLFAYAPAEQELEHVYRTLEEDLRKSSAQFKRSQDDLTMLMQEFFKNRKTLFLEEQQAADAYVTKLKWAISLFNNSFEKYPATLNTAFEQCASALGTVRAGISGLAGIMKEFSGDNFKASLKEMDQMGQAAGRLKGDLNSLGLSAQQLSARAQKESEELKGRVKALRADLEDIDRILTDFIKVSRNHISALT